MLNVDLLNSALVEYLTHHVQTRLKKHRKRQGEKPKRKPGNEVLVPVECLEVCLEWVECLGWVVCLVAWKVCDFSTRHLDSVLSPHDYFQVCKE